MGGPARSVASDFSDARFPVWNTDANMLLFEGCRARAAPLSACADWWVANMDGTGVRRTGVLALLRSKRLELLSPPVISWHTDDLFFSAVSGTLLALWELPLSRNNPSVSGEPRRLTSGDGNERDPSMA